MIWKVTLDVQKYFQILVQECSKPEKSCLPGKADSDNRVSTSSQESSSMGKNTRHIGVYGYCINAVYFSHVNKRERETLAKCCHLSVLSIENEIAADVLDLDYEDQILILVFWNVS